MAVEWDNMESTLEFSEPGSLRECREKIRDLVEAIGKIERQLSDRHLTDKRGRRLSNTKYHKWRRNALRALHASKIQLRWHKDWQREELRRREALRFDVEPGSCDDLIVAGYNLLQAKRIEGTEFDPRELGLLSLIQDYVRGTIKA